MKHESYPYNKKIAQVLYLTKNLEKWGTGANRMIDLCREQGVPEPEWKVENGTVTIIFRRSQIAGTSNNSNDNPSNVSQEASQNDTKDDTKELSGFLQKKERLNDRQKKILYLITEDRKITVSKLSITINISTATVYRDLKVIGIHWDGPSKTGQWIIDEHLD